MFQTLADKVTNFMIKNDIIQKEDEEIYSYGLKAILSSLANTLVILLIGLYFGYGLETLVFMLCYCPLRQFSGGYHAPTYFKCLLSFIVIYFLTLFIFTISKGDILAVHVAVVLFACGLTILFLAPIDNRNKPLDSEEKHKYKRIAIRIVSIEAFIIILLLAGNELIIRCCIFGTLAIAWVTVLMLLGFIKNSLEAKKGGSIHERIN